jgi:hypothetical protein
VVEMIADRIRLAYRVRRWGAPPAKGAARTWDGSWEWRFPLEFTIARRRRI